MSQAVVPPTISVSGQPLVSLVVATYNEADSIGACIASIVGQDYPAASLEILIYDGGSSDATVAIAQRLLAERPLAAVRENPGRIQAAAWNRGIMAASGGIVGIVSGHAELDPGYVRAAVEALERTGADLVGGPVRAIGQGPIGEAIALAISTVFGAGGARFRLTNRVEEVDTVFMGLARRETYRRFPFDEEMVRNQDDELSYRLRDAGGRIVCDPAIRSRYRSRGTLRGLAGQYWAYGYWKVRVLQKHPGQVRLRQLIPPAFVLALAAAGAAIAAGGSLSAAGWLVLVAYLAANLAATLAATRGRRRLMPILPIAYATLHLAYGAGFLVGLVRFRTRWPAGAALRMAAAIGGRSDR